MRPPLSGLPPYPSTQALLRRYSVSFKGPHLSRSLTPCPLISVSGSHFPCVFACPHLCFLSHSVSLTLLAHLSVPSCLSLTISLTPLSLHVPPLCTHHHGLCTPLCRHLTKKIKEGKKRNHLVFIRVMKPWWPCNEAAGPAHLLTAASRLGPQPGPACFQKHTKHGDRAGPHRGQGMLPSGIRCLLWTECLCSPQIHILTPQLLVQQYLEVGPLGGNSI